jgi:glycerophosphoryl diester phosphodiesterase
MYDGMLGVLTLEELLDLREQESARAGRRLGVHIELKHAALFTRMRMPLHESLVAILRERRLDSAFSPVSVMSFDSDFLKRVRRDLDVEMVQLVGPEETVRARRLQRVGAYATTVGLSKHLALPRDASGAIGEPGPAVLTAFNAGLDVLVWTLRSENRHLPANLRSTGPAREHGNAAEEVTRLLDLGVDGLMTDFPEVAAEVRAGRVGQIAL